MEPRIGVYVCHCGVNIADTVDVKSVAQYASGLPNVVVARDHTYVCSDPGQSMIKEDIQEKNLNRVVVAACSPRMHESTFQRLLEEAGLNRYLLQISNIREQCSWVHEDATQKSVDLVRAAVARASYLEPLEYLRGECERATLIIGGGVAGIFAALNLAKAGFQVYLVERQPSIGGHMAQFGKVFPTLDCAQCILTPRMSECADHPDIKLFTYSEVRSVEGFAGNFKVKVVKKPRYVDVEACTSCGICAEKCPVKVPNEFDQGLGMRKAIYLQFPQAVPSKYVIDSGHCLYFTKKSPKYPKGVCRICEHFCPSGAIRFDQEPEEIDLHVGSVIVATGFDLFDTREIKEYGYGQCENVVTGLEFERIANIEGPTKGLIIRPSDHQPVKSVAFILCVGSREEKSDRLRYCCRVGCVAAVKHAYLLKSTLGDDVDVYICYTDFRTFGKGHEEFYQKVRNMGVKFLRGKPSDIRRLPDGSLTLDVYDTITNRLYQLRADLVVLMTGLQPSEGAEELAKALRIPQGPDGFFIELHPKLYPAETVVNGVYIAGVAQGPKDITDTIAHTGNAAATAAALMAKGEIVKDPLVAYLINLERCDGCGECVEACPQGAVTLAEGKPEINPLLCTGCGLCVSRCPRDALDLRGCTEQQLESEIEAVLVEASEAPRIIAFTEAALAYAAADLIGLNRLTYPTSIRIIRLPSTARLKLEHILYAFALGADGVLLVEAPREGPFGLVHELAEDIAKQYRKRLSEYGIKGRRFRFASFFMPEYKKMADLFQAFDSVIRGMGPLRPETRAKLLEHVKEALVIGKASRGI